MFELNNLLLGIFYITYKLMVIIEFIVIALNSVHNLME